MSFGEPTNFLPAAGLEGVPDAPMSILVRSAGGLDIGESCSSRMLGIGKTGGRSLGVTGLINVDDAARDDDDWLLAKEDVEKRLRNSKNENRRLTIGSTVEARAGEGLSKERLGVMVGFPRRRKVRALRLRAELSIFCAFERRNRLLKEFFRGFVTALLRLSVDMVGGCTNSKLSPPK